MVGKKFLILFLPLLILLSACVGGASYALWSKVILNESNLFYTGRLNFLVNEKNGVNKIPLRIDNLYPSDLYYEEEMIEIKNTGTMAIKYRINFDSEVDNALLFYTKVSFDQGETWIPLILAEYLEIQNPLPVNERIQIPVWFQLSKDYEAYTMNDEASFNIIVKAVQYEDTLESIAVNTTQERELNDVFGAIQFINYNPGSHEEVIISDSLNTSNVEMNLNANHSDDYGAWEGNNPFIIRYSSSTGTLIVNVNGNEESYTLSNPKSLEVIQFHLTNHQTSGTLKIDGLKLNGKFIYHHLLSSEVGTTLYISGNILDLYGNLELEGTLKVSGKHPTREHSKVEILLGN